MRHLLRALITLFLISQIALVQASEKRESRLPLWTFHEKNVSIYGLSIGGFSGYGFNRNTVTNGVRLEIPGIGFLAPLGNGSPVSDIDTIGHGIKRQDFVFSEIVNGINISTGSWGELNYNGLTIGLFAQNGYLANGLAVSGLWNSVNKVNGISFGGLLLNEALQHNGIQVGGLASSSIIMSGVQIGVLNEAKTMSGVQIGLINKTNKSRGFQFGLWNINERRRLPLINWNFRNKE